MLITLKINLNRLLLTLWIIAGVLVGIHVLLNVIHYQITELDWLARQIFDVD